MLGGRHARPDRAPIPPRPKRPGRRRQPSHPRRPARPGTGGGRVLHVHRHLPGLHPARPRPGPAGPTHPRRAAGGGGTRIADARRPGPAHPRRPGHRRVLRWRPGAPGGGTAPDPAPSTQRHHARRLGRRRAIPAGDRPAHRQLRRPGAAGRDRPAVRRQPSSPTRRERTTTMQRTAAAAGSAVFFVLAPGTIVGLVPWLITGWHPGAPLSHLLPLRVLGAVLVVAGTAILVSAFARFVVEGLGTPAPVAPPAHLVVGGLYRHVRNPIYLALDATILGQAILLWRPDLLWYTGFVALALVAWVYGLEQPELQGRFGARYDEYRRAVPGWWPRRRPWQPR